MNRSSLIAAAMLLADSAAPAGFPSFFEAPRDPHQGRSRGRYGHIAPLAERLRGKKRRAKVGKGGRR